MSLPIYTVRKVDKGQIVRWVQERLGVTPTGVFGPQTEHEVVQWQLLHGLAADGICGPATLATMGIRVNLRIDVSHHNGAIDYAAVARAGIGDVVVKVSQGNGGTDHLGASNIAGFRAVGIEPTAYHFAVPDARANDAVLEAHCAIDRAQGCKLALDLEQTGGLSGVALGDWTGLFLRTVESLTGSVPELYTTGDYLRNRIRDEDLSRYPLWVSRLWRSRTDPGVVKTWRAWQFSWTGTIPGINGDVDCSWVVSRD